MSRFALRRSGKDANSASITAPGAALRWMLLRAGLLATFALGAFGAAPALAITSADTATGIASGQNGPLAGITVTVTDNSDAARDESVTTAANGSFTLQLYDGDDYVVKYSGAGILTQYANELEDEIDGGIFTYNAPLDSNSTSFTFDDEIAATGGHTTNFESPVNLSAGEVTGTVTDPNLASINSTYALSEDESIYFYDATTGRYVGAASTAPGGTYTEVLPAGTYYAEFDPPSSFTHGSITTSTLEQPLWFGGHTAEAGSTALTVSQGQTTANVNQTLSVNGGAIAIPVTVPAGTAVSDVGVTLENAAGGVVDEDEGTLVDPSGSLTSATYLSAPLPAGTYYAYIYYANDNGPNLVAEYYGGSSSLGGATGLMVVAGQTDTANTVNLTAGATISGTVTGAPTKDLNIGDVWVEVSTSGGYEAEAEVSPSGGYSVAGLIPGTYYVEVFDDAIEDDSEFGTYWYAGAGVTSSYIGAQPLTVGAGGSVTADISIPALGAVSGVVVTSGGVPVADVEVWVYNQEGIEAGYAYTGNDGSYVIANLLPGAYSVEFDPINEPEDDDISNLAFQFYSNSATFGGAQTVTVTAGQDTGEINASLVAGGEITGTVEVVKTNQLASDVSVTLLDKYGDRVDTTSSLEDGTYTFYGVPAGTYYVVFDANDSGFSYDPVPGAGTMFYETSFYGGAGSLAGARPVTVTAGQITSGINGTVTPEQLLTITPTQSKLRLAGLAKGKTSLRFKLTQGAYDPPLAVIKVGLPAGFSWVRKQLARDLSLGKVRFMDSVKGRTLTLYLAPGHEGISLTVKAGAIKISAKLEQKARKRKLKSETITISVSNVAGGSNLLDLLVKRPH